MTQVSDLYETILNSLNVQVCQINRGIYVLKVLDDKQTLFIS